MIVKDSGLLPNLLTWQKKFRNSRLRGLCAPSRVSNNPSSRFLVLPLDSNSPAYACVSRNKISRPKPNIACPTIPLCGPGRGSFDARIKVSGFTNRISTKLFPPPSRLAKLSGPKRPTAMWTGHLLATPHPLRWGIRV